MSRIVSMKEHNLVDAIKRLVCIKTDAGLVLNASHRKIRPSSFTCTIRNTFRNIKFVIEQCKNVHFHAC